MRWAAASAAITLVALTASSCAVDIRQVPVATRETPKIWSDERPLYIGGVEIRSADRKYLNQAWTTTLASVIRSRRIFKNVAKLPDDETPLGADYLVLDIDVNATYDESYNWWVTWPAVYPAPGWWPFQVRTGTYKVTARYRLTGPGARAVTEGLIEHESSETLRFYGFFRTSALERMIETANLEVMHQCAEAVFQVVSLPPLPQHR